MNTSEYRGHSETTKIKNPSTTGSSDYRGASNNNMTENTISTNSELNINIEIQPKKTFANVTKQLNELQIQVFPKKD